MVDFSEMGAALYQSLFPNEKAKDALLNIGSEEIKGTELLKGTYTKLKKLDGELGLLTNKQYLIVGTTQIPMLPEFLLLLLFLGSALYAWRVEGR